MPAGNVLSEGARRCRRRVQAVDGMGLSWMGGWSATASSSKIGQLVESIEELAKDGAARLRPRGRGEDALLRLLPALHANMVAHLEISAVFSSMIADEH